MVDKGIFKTITGASFLLVLLLGLIFLYAQSFTTSGLFPNDVESWNKILTGYLVIFALVLIGAGIYAPETIRQLAQADYWKSFGLKFIPSAIIVSILLILVKALLKGTDTINLLNFISYMPMSVLIFHLFVVTQVEEIMFGGLIYTAFEKRNGTTTANYVTAVLFSIFHFAKAGGSFIVMATYFPLRLWWNYQRNYGIPLLADVPVIGQKFFGATPYTQQSNAGAHFAWNAFVISFIQPFRI